MRTEPFDSGDLDAILELERSPGYALVVERIQSELERNRTYLEGFHEGDATAATRGRIAALRTVLGIPVILKHEIKSSLKE